MNEAIRISEIFGPTIQGEGALIGVPTVFVRTGGCDYRCVWCDSLHAVNSEYRHDWTPMSASAVMDEVRRLSGGQPLTVTLSGGNPAIQPFGELIAMGREGGYGFALETQGSISKDWFSQLEMLVLSPKPPSSEMQTDWGMLQEGVDAAQGAPTVLKSVVCDDADYAYARDAAARYPGLPIYLQPGNHTPPPPGDDTAAVDLPGIDARMRWLVDLVIADRWHAARVLPQLHVMLWGNKRGV
jgi:7-carboxy-7-deazaguanine synthase